MNTQWQKKYLLEYNELVSNFPSPEKVASDYIKSRFKTDLHWFSWVDPDNTYFIQFSQSRSNRRSYTGWDHLGKYKTDVLTLTQAALVNIGYRFEVFDDANSNAGIYKKNNAEMFNETNEAKMLPSEYLYFLQQCDFAGLYEKALSDYWSKYYEKFKLLLKNYYISSALYLYKNGVISEYEHDFAMNALNRKDNISLFFFDIYGYYSSDIFVAKNNDGIMLFIPGATNPFLFSKNITNLRTRLKKLIKENDNKELLSRHFSLYYRQDGSSYSGVNSVLHEIVNNGSFNESYLLYSNKTLSERDIFDTVALSVKKRSFSDGDTVIKSNSEAQRDYALTILQTILSMAPVFDVVVPEVSVPLSLGTLAASMGISFDQLINGDTYEERRSAIPGLATNAVLIGLSFAIPFLISKAGANQQILSEVISNEDSILNETNIDDFLKEYGISKDSISSTSVLEVDLENSSQPINLVKLSDEGNQIVAVKGSALSGIYYEVDIETGYEILSRRIYRTEYNNEILWTRGGGLKGGQPFDFESLNIPIFFKDNPYSAVADSPLSFINDDSSLLYPGVSSRLPQPTSEMEVVNYANGTESSGEKVVTLMRGTTEEEAWNIANYQTAGGSNEELQEILLGQGSQSNLNFTEYTSNVNSADAASRRHFLVVIKVRVRHINNNNVSHVNHWAIPDEAPVEVLAVVDRRFNSPEPSTPPNLSTLQKLLSLRYFKESIEGTSKLNFQKLSRGNIDILKGRGSISSTRQRAISPYFESANADELRPNFFFIKKDRFTDFGYDSTFYNNNLGLNGAPTLNTYTGEILSDSSSLGSTYWKKYNLTNETSIIRVSNSARGANGIKIALEEVQEGKPVIITSGNLSGCTTIVARKGEYLYKVHTGTTEPVVGFTSTTGVKKAVEVFELLKNSSDANVTKITNNDFLVNYLADNFDESLITYSSSKEKLGSEITVNRDNVSTFPYYINNIPTQGFGTSATILVRVDGNVVVRSLSESYSAEGSTVSVLKIFSKDF
ncbi:CNF1 family cytotoxic necrotizing factor [Yersinia ruckeri]|nr:CNF1 family cytotoxic necrotizing factor [Yersinia ruckeri]EKN4692881.1 CNF1 family cytotoxic necrotizing factor [Yersinia ruckeri]EKN4696769.1 CNF1 family cytotoxic necrotizing factor [Yersinia ruckeri]